MSLSHENFNRTRAILTFRPSFTFSTTNWNYLPNFTQINTRCLKRFRVYIITFDAAKVRPVSQIVTVWQLINLILSVIGLFHIARRKLPVIGLFHNA